MLGFFRREEAPPTPSPDRLPAELVAAIERLSVIRRAPCPDQGERIAVAVPGLGMFYVGNEAKVKARILAAYPELSPVCARRAVELMDAVIGSRMRAPTMTDRPLGWVFDYDDTGRWFGNG